MSTRVKGVNKAFFLCFGRKNVTGNEFPFWSIRTALSDFSVSLVAMDPDYSPGEKAGFSERALVNQCVI